jgi:hypothetical protein
VAIWALLTVGDVFVPDEFAFATPLAYGNLRQHAQRGMFTVLRDREHADVAAYLHSRGKQDRLTCWTVPFHELETALIELRRMNITWGTLFPDLDGAAKEANGLSAWEKLSRPTQPMTVYGRTGLGDVRAGSQIEALVGDLVIGSTEADAEGWSISLQDGDIGQEVTFNLDGKATRVSVAYEPFGFAEIVLAQG